MRLILSSLSLRTVALLAAVAIALLFFWGLGSVPFLSVNEARRAVTVREMREAGSWLLPYMNGDLYLSKPPFFYWAGLVSTAVLGSLSEWSVRLPSALAATVCCIGTYLYGVRQAGRQAGLFAVVFLAANGAFSLFARRSEIEMLLTLLCFGALLAAWHFIFQQGRAIWSRLSYVLLGCALLTKGPVCLLWVTAPILAYALIYRDARAKAYLCDGWGWLIALVLGGSWYVAVSMNQGWGIWASIVNEDIVKKIDGQGAEAWYAYLLYLAGDFFPFWLIVFVQPRRFWAMIRARREAAMLLCCSLLPLLVFSCFTEKHGKYLLPIYPSMALLLAMHWAAVFDTAKGRWRACLATVPYVMLAGFVVFYMFVEARVLSHRVGGLEQVATLAAGQPGQKAYSVGEPDIRLVYYMGRPVTTLTVAQLQGANRPVGLLFAQEPLEPELRGLAACKVGEVEPYLKPDHAALLVHLAADCR
ncbi:ArnT family glycosyltransferase [Pseudomonas izuensis]|uniref:Glycosyltransferase family 39 protein n=1 Tax=Pseudomonas izuensis TaxID=2684212 RepID=A0ABM7RUM5_9PSED|nr:glycosyltransferase family 39 protein [Pseudomonas izuensis]BCX69460.1 glycosyltransferase family 39 protein [Pseudomonas izuensis]